MKEHSLVYNKYSNRFLIIEQIWWCRIYENFFSTNTNSEIIFKHSLGQWIKITLDEIIVDTPNNIQKYGYSLIGIHPQEFAISDIITDYSDNSLSIVVNENEIKDLWRLIDKILPKDIKITGFQKIVDKYEND